VNGTIATVISIMQDKITDYIEKIKILLSTILEYFIQRVSVKFQVMDRVYIIRNQFPLFLSYALPFLPKSRFEFAVMDLGNNVFSWLMLHYLE